MGDYPATGLHNGRSGAFFNRAVAMTKIVTSIFYSSLPIFVFVHFLFFFGCRDSELLKLGELLALQA